VTDLDTGYHL
jgi:hypothetical protein